MKKLRNVKKKVFQLFHDVGMCKCNNVDIIHLKLGDDLLDINNFPNSVQISERCDGSRILQWNPMEVDFLAPKNNYAYDEEDASIAIQGYSEYI